MKLTAAPNLNWLIHLFIHIVSSNQSTLALIELYYIQAGIKCDCWFVCLCPICTRRCRFVYLSKQILKVTSHQSPTNSVVHPLKLKSMYTGLKLYSKSVGFYYKQFCLFKSVFPLIFRFVPAKCNKN